MQCVATDWLSGCSPPCLPQPSRPDSCLLPSQAISHAPADGLDLTALGALNPPSISCMQSPRAHPVSSKYNGSSLRKGSR
jgi:hypothetical protein